MKKLVVLDFVSQVTYVFDYDTSVHEDAIECIESTSGHLGLQISINNCQFMEVDNFKLEVL